MARKHRIRCQGAIYHVMNRGDQDRTMFLEPPRASGGRTAREVHALCLMPHHFHRVIETPQPNLVGG
jgi:putative transposase